MGERSEAEAAETRRRWQAGLCPCCGMSLIPWPGPDGVEHMPEAIGEDVELCGRCMGNRHYIEAAEQILRELAE